MDEGQVGAGREKREREIGKNRWGEGEGQSPGRKRQGAQASGRGKEVEFLQIRFSCAASHMPEQFQVQDFRAQPPSRIAVLRQCKRTCPRPVSAQPCRRRSSGLKHQVQGLCLSTF